MKFYHFTQNNSGGYHIRNDTVCEELIIEARDYEEANAIMRRIVEDYSEYCECCGERWSENWDETDGQPFPHIWGEPLEKVERGCFRESAYIYRYGSQTPEQYIFKEK